MDYDIYLELAKQNRIELQTIPEKFITEELCLAIIKDDIQELFYVPKNIKTNKFWTEALKQDIKVFRHIKNPTQEVINHYNLMNL